MKQHLIRSVSTLVILLGMTFTSEAITSPLPFRTLPVFEPVKKCLVRYVGKKEDGILFDVFADNPGGRKLYVQVRDTQNEVLYKEVSNDTLYSKRFLLPLEGMQELKVVIRREGEKNEQIFVISSKLTWEEKVFISRIN
jgi:hypothetical protein